MRIPPDNDHQQEFAIIIIMPSRHRINGWAADPVFKATDIRYH